MNYQRGSTEERGSTVGCGNYRRLRWIRVRLLVVPQHGLGDRSAADPCILQSWSSYTWSAGLRGVLADPAVIKARVPAIVRIARE